MFGRSDQRQGLVEPVAEVEPPPPPLTRTEELERRQAVLERRLNTPSTFASRKAQAPAASGRKLVFMGRDERPLSTGIHVPEHAVVEVELYFEKDNPSQTYFRLPGGVLQEIAQTSGKQDTVATLRTMPATSRPAGAFEPSPPDPAPRPV